MEDRLPLEDLLRHLERTTLLGRDDAARVVADVLAYFSETPAEFVRRRHRELKDGDLANPEIFERIRGELKQRRFAGPDLSTRQVRRLIYG